MVNHNSINHQEKQQETQVDSTATLLILLLSVLLLILDCEGEWSELALPDFCGDGRILEDFLFDLVEGLVDVGSIFGTGFEVGDGAVVTFDEFVWHLFVQVALSS